MLPSVASILKLFSAGVGVGGHEEYHCPTSDVTLTLNPTFKFPSEIEIHKFQFQASRHHAGELGGGLGGGVD